MNDEHTSGAVLELPDDGPAAPPRTNGEIVFDAPWQSRAFGVAAALAEAGRLTWPDFQAALIERVAEADRTGLDTGAPDGYWRCWLDALGAIAVASGAIDGGAWDQRATEFAQRPAGHDHDHGDHDHHGHEHHDHADHGHGH